MIFRYDVECVPTDSLHLPPGEIAVVIRNLIHEAVFTKRMTLKVDGWRVVTVERSSNESE